MSHLQRLFDVVTFTWETNFRHRLTHELWNSVHSSLVSKVKSENCNYIKNVDFSGLTYAPVCRTQVERQSPGPVGLQEAIMLSQSASAETKGAEVQQASPLLLA